MEFLIRLYYWGVIADLLFWSYFVIMYSFGFKERSTYQANLNKVDLSWDPLSLAVYPLPEFKHSSLRFWRMQFFDLFGTLLSWYSVLYRVHRILKVREIKSMLTADQKRAAFVLRNEPTLTREEVLQQLRILDPSIPGTEQIENRSFGYAKTSTKCFWCDNEIRLREMVLYYGEPPAQVPSTQQTAIFHYGCAMTLNLYQDDNSSLCLYSNLKKRLEAGDEIKQLLLKDSPRLEVKINEPSDVTVKEDVDEKGLMIGMADTIILERLFARASDEEEKKGGRVTKFITELESTSYPLTDFMAPLLEIKSQNPIALGDILVALTEEDNHHATVVEIVREALNKSLKKFGWVNNIPLTHFMTTLENLDDPILIANLKAALERALGEKDHVVIATLNTQLLRLSRS